MAATTLLTSDQFLALHDEFDQNGPSESAAYLRIKTAAYRANGSRSVWIVFPEVRTVMIYTHDSVREPQAKESICDPLLPGFSAPVAAFFELT